MKFKPISSKGLKTYSIKDRKSKVSVDDFARLPKGGSFADFLSSLPGILAAKDLLDVASTMARAHADGRTVAVGMGAHVIKVGLAPLLIDLMERGVVTSVAMNGACVVHDFESAYAGCTSEDVDAELGSGAFGMAEETGRLLNRAIRKDGAKKGLGRAVGEMINSSRFPYKDTSIIAAGARLDVPITVHVALGTDIIHIHPQMDGAATGAASTTDFKIFSSVVSTLEEGIYVNIGSAVILPEVFLKALTLVRNLGHEVKNFSTVNMDFIQHYRPLTNVVRRPTMGGRGKGYRLTGHHEIMVPLLYWALMEELKSKSNGKGG